MITYEDFKKIEIKIGKVISVEKITNRQAVSDE